MPDVRPEYDWSGYAGQYVLESGRTLTWPMLATCMEQRFFPVLDEIVAKATAASKQPVRVLILAGGPGPEVPLLLNRYGRDTFRILLTDAAPAMVEMAKSNMASAGVEEVVETRLMDATNIDVPAESFDIVFICYGIFAIAEYERCLQQIARALKPGGILFLSTPGTKSVPLKLIDEEKRKWLKEHYEAQHPIVKEYEKGIAELQDGPWRNIDLVRARLQACSLFDEDLSVVTVPCVWCSTSEKDINQLFTSLYHHPMVNLRFLTGFSGEEERLAFFERVRKGALAVANAEDGLRTESVCAWARKRAIADH